MSNHGFLLHERCGDDTRAEGEDLWRSAAEWAYAHTLCNIGALLTERRDRDDIGRGQMLYRDASDQGYAPPCPTSR